VVTLATETPLLRPLSVAEILDAAFNVYRRRFKELVTISAIVQVPLALVQAVLMGLLFGTLANTNPNDPTALLGVFGGALLLTPIAALGGMIVYAALAVAVSHQYLAQPISVRSAFTQVWPHLGVLLLIWLLMVLLVTAGILLCVVPGIYLGIALAFAWPVAVLEGRGVGDALSRSFFLVNGNWWRVFATMLLLSLIMAVIQGALTYPLTILTMVGLIKNPALSQALIQFISSLAGVLVLPLYTGALVILYYDLRVRREGFDLQLLFSEIAPRVGVASSSLPPIPGQTKAEVADVSPVAAGLSTELPPLPPPPPPGAAQEALFPDRSELPPLPAAPPPPPPGAHDHPADESPTPQ
jgi:hypothetical protein